MSEIVDELVGPKHVALYRATDGELGYSWRGSEILLLTTIGNRSGRAFTTPLIFTTDGDNFVIVASNAGAPDDPAWFKNLQSSGNAEVQVRADRFPVHMRIAEGEERARLWDAMVASWQYYEHYQRKADREIPVVLLERSCARMSDFSFPPSVAEIRDRTTASARASGTAEWSRP